MKVNIKPRPAKLVTSGYSMTVELKAAIRVRANKENCSASQLIVAVMTAYLEIK